MKKNGFIILVAFALTLAFVFLIRKTTITNRRGNGSVFIAPGKYKATFDKSIESGDKFYNLYGKARESISAGHYEDAIKFLNESESYVGDGLEKGMVYKKLAEIYRKQGNLEKELYYVEEWPKYSMNQQINEEAKSRAAEIRRILQNQKQNVPGVNAKIISVSSNKPFVQNIAEPDEFYPLFTRAREAAKAGDNAKAIKLFEQCLPHAKIGIEKGMVYYQLIKIYHDLGNLEQELKYSELLPRYSMNEEENKKALQRAAEIRRILQNQKQNMPGVNVQ